MTIYFNGNLSSSIIVPPWHHVHDSAENLAANGSGTGTAIPDPFGLSPSPSGYILKLETTGLLAGSGATSRVEVGTDPAATTAHSGNGQETYYGFSVRFPSSNRGNWAPALFDWNNVFQCITANTFLAPVHLGVDTGGYGVISPHLFLDLDTKQDGTGAANGAAGRWEDTVPVDYDTWTDFVIRVLWSTTTSGLVELWKNGVKVYAVAGIRTLIDATNLPYVEFQNYHSYVNATLVHYFTSIKFGSTYAEVAPSRLAGPSAVTLAQIEQAAAPRMGPYAQRTQSSTIAATVSLAYFDELKSSANPGGVENLYMLRRGQLANGSTVAVAAGDRQRIAATYDPLQGSVAPDRPWATGPAAGELIEFHHLDPALELRPAVLSGLRRCYFEDRATVTLSSAATERDLTSAVFWINRPDQVRRYQFTTTGATILPEDVEWATPFEKGGHVWLQAWPDQYPNTLLVTGLRSHFTWVNGADSATGPTADTDTLTVDLAYAASAAHIEGWKLFKAKLKLAADAGFQSTQQEAAAEFTREAIVQKRRRRTGWNLSGPFGESQLSARAR